MVRRALTRQTRWYQNRCSTFNIKDVIVPKPFWKILEFWPLVTSILTWAKKWPKWFRNDFSWAFERRFLFCSTMRRSRDRRGGVQTPPPPPSRSWKIQRPSRARVKTPYWWWTNSFQHQSPSFQAVCLFTRNQRRNYVGFIITTYPRRHRPFRILPRHKGGWYDPPPPCRFAPDWARASRKKRACSSPRDEEIDI